MAKGKNNGKKNKNANLKAAYQTKREIWGVVIIALGLFLGASLYSDAVGIFGRAISGFVFGMFGIATLRISRLRIKRERTRGLPTTWA